MQIHTVYHLCILNSNKRKHYQPFLQFKNLIFHVAWKETKLTAAFILAITDNVFNNFKETFVTYQIGLTERKIILKCILRIKWLNIAQMTI